jgi:hypothetical protein
MTSVWSKPICRVAASGVPVKACKAPHGRAGLRSQNGGATPILRPRMDNYHYPYSDDPESAPLTRVGRLTECALVLLLAVLAVYLSG